MGIFEIASSSLNGAQNLAKRVKKVHTMQLRAGSLHAPLDENAVLYESYSGNGMVCHPEAIFRRLLEADDMNHLKHIWVLKDMSRFRSTVQKFQSNNRVRFVKYGSLAYYKALQTSKYLINNVSFPQQFSKRDGQIYVNTWHGVPLKKMGFDVKGGAVDTRNMIRNFLSADYLLSAGPRMTEQMYTRAFKLMNVYEGSILEVGNPRIDWQFKPAQATSELRQWLNKFNMDLDEREVVLYAPTWKGSDFTRPSNDAASLAAIVIDLESRIDCEKYRVLVKAHQLVAEEMKSNEALTGRLVPNDIPTNVVLAATSILITDYSSIFYDFIATGKPVIFYTPDIESYRTYRDVYVEPESFPGRLAYSVEELASHVTDTLRDGWGWDQSVRARYDEAVQAFTKHDDGQASGRVVDVVFRRQTHGYDIIQGFADGREKILLYAGGLASNGITSSVTNLLDNIDYSRFDVTVLYPFSRSREKKANAEKLNSNARVIARDGTFNGGYLANKERIAEQLQGWGAEAAHSPRVEELWRNEWRRIFGDANFDYIIDFTGYAPFWDFLLLQGTAKSHSIWLHNDLAADAERTVDGKQPLRAGLRAVFSTYRRFDHLVSVSEALADINRENLAGWAPAASFTSAVNSIGPSKIRELAYGRTVEPHPSVMVRTDRRGLVDDVSALLEAYPTDAARVEFERQSKLKVYRREEELTTFITVGRLSPEKNHARLIDAFAVIHREHPETRLLIVGTGPLAGELEAQIARLSLHRAVVLTGKQENPFALMAMSDCFVLSSDYEGQPMVLLEAMTLGRPILTTAFGSARSALPQGYGLVVDRTVGALVEGMREFIEGGLPVVGFDADEYNKEAMREFYRSVGASQE